MYRDDGLPRQVVFRNEDKHVSPGRDIQVMALSVVVQDADCRTVMGERIQAFRIESWAALVRWLGIDSAAGRNKTNHYGENCDLIRW
jgi:hypothetical protein